MTREQRMVHERLLSVLPVRKHEDRRGEYVQRHGIGNRHSIPAKHKAGRPVRYRGKEFPSISKAARGLRFSVRKLYELIEAGRAELL